MSRDQQRTSTASAFAATASTTSLRRAGARYSRPWATKYWLVIDLSYESI
jgi:hypothetical protein